MSVENTPASVKEEKIALKVIFGGHLVLMTGLLHPVSNNANAWLCST